MDQHLKSILLCLMTVLFSDGDVSSQEFDLLDISGMLQADHCSIVSKFIEEEAISQFQLRYYYGVEPEDFIAVYLNESTRILSHPRYNPSACMVVYMTGWKQRLDTQDTAASNKVFVENCDCNFIAVDWTAVSTNPLYHMSVSMTPKAGKAIASSLDALIDAGASLCYLCGISLGGQGAGHVARNMKNRVRHLITFDPAGPLFYPPVVCVPPVSEEDADCVEVIHTDRGGLGAPVRTGTFDYWVNGGPSPQPGCLLPKSGRPRIGCSHIRSQVLFMQILRDPTLFPSRYCSSWLEFTLNGCSGNTVNYIGQCNKESKPGNYYLRTSGSEPFGLRSRGASPSLLPNIFK
ncbi:lipase member H-A [Anabrus simplex]|uniref:lipase member H-A n=1 Tax=Anabrus simplex TaxID=316456 RepID=UPI0035A2EAB8